MQNFLFFGFGMMGSSFAGFIRSKISKVNITAFDPNQENIDFGVKNGLIDQVYNENLDILYDFVIVASPLSTYEAVFQKISQNSSRFNCIFDIGSVNEYPYRFINNAKFVSCHPICGSNIAGVAGYDPKVFENSLFLISKNDKNHQNAQNIANIIEKIGMKVEFIEAEQHDKVYSLVSHLPQFLSFLTKVFCGQDIQDSLPRAFRLNDSSPTIWSDIFAINGNNLQLYYEQFFDNLIDIYENIDQGNYNFFANLLKKINLKLDNPSDFDIGELTDEELAQFLFRLTIVMAYVIIEDVDSYRSYAGRGFEDFVSIVNIAQNTNPEQLLKLIKSNKSRLISYFNEISS